MHYFSSNSFGSERGTKIQCPDIDHEKDLSLNYYSSSVYYLLHRIYWPSPIPHVIIKLSRWINRFGKQDYVLSKLNLCVPISSITPDIVFTTSNMIPEDPPSQSEIKISCTCSMSRIKTHFPDFGCQRFLKYLFKTPYIRLIFKFYKLTADPPKFLNVKDSAKTTDNVKINEE